MGVTVPLDPRTDATRMLDTGTRDVTVPLAPQQQQPRRRRMEPIDEAPRRRPPVAAGPVGEPQRARPRRRSPLRALGWLVALLAVAAIGFGVYQLEAGQGREPITVDQVDPATDAREALDRLEQVIRDNTR
jgi:hypothetical protein